MARTIAYLRVSTEKQNLEKNKADILKLANEKRLGNVDFVQEKISGKVSWKERKLGSVIESLNAGDSLLVSELSRLGRSMLGILQILAICVERGIKVYAVKGNWTLDGSLQSKILAMVLSLCAEIESSLISARTKEALRALKAKGVTLGRPKGKGKSKLDKYCEEIIALLKNGSTQKFIANRYKVHESTLCNWMNKKGYDRQELINKAGD